MFIYSDCYIKEKLCTHYSHLVLLPVPPFNLTTNLRTWIQMIQINFGEVQPAAKYSDTSIDSAMDWYNDAERFEEDYEYTFTELPLAGRLSKIPWSGDYWAKKKDWHRIQMANRREV